jgi:hypothetical protein
MREIAKEGWTEVQIIPPLRGLRATDYALVPSSTTHGTLLIITAISRDSVSWDKAQRRGQLATTPILHLLAVATGMGILGCRRCVDVGVIVHGWCTSVPPQAQADRNSSELRNSGEGRTASFIYLSLFSRQRDDTNTVIHCNHDNDDNVGK